MIGVVLKECIRMTNLLCFDSFVKQQNKKLFLNNSPVGHLRLIRATSEHQSSKVLKAQRT